MDAASAQYPLTMDPTDYCGEQPNGGGVIYVCIGALKRPTRVFVREVAM